MPLTCYACCNDSDCCIAYDIYCFHQVETFIGLASEQNRKQMGNIKPLRAAKASFICNHWRTGWMWAEPMAFDIFFFHFIATFNLYIWQQQDSDTNMKRVTCLHIQMSFLND